MSEWKKKMRDVCVCEVLSVSHYTPTSSAISHRSVNRKIQHFLLLISFSEQMMPEIFILFIMEFQWPLLQIKWKFLHMKWEKLNVNHVLMWLRVTGTLFLLIIHQLLGSNKAKERAMFVAFLFHPSQRLSSHTLCIYLSLTNLTHEILLFYIKNNTKATACKSFINLFIFAGLQLDVTPAALTTHVI